MSDFSLMSIDAAYAIAMACITYKKLTPEQQEDFSKLYDVEFNRAADYFNLRREQFKEADDNTHFAVVLSAFHTSFNSPAYKHIFEENVVNMFSDEKLCITYRESQPDFIQIKEKTWWQDILTLSVDSTMAKIQDVTEEFLVSDFFYEALNHRKVSKMKEYVEEVLPLIQNHRQRHGLKPLDIQTEDYPKVA